MDIIRAIQTPPLQDSACAFWFWNGELSSARMLRQMDEMRAKGVYAAFMHARAYLKTPYMGDTWFRVMDDCVRHAKTIGFYPWLYDEYAWPSGTCGSIFNHGMQAPSRVLAKGQHNMAKGLDPKIIDGDPDPSRKLIAACPLADGRTMAFYERVYQTAVDYLNPDTIRDFLDCTHEVYKVRYGTEFGKSIPGIFFDEIYLAACPLPWTDRLPEVFQETYGYDLLQHLPALMQGDDSHARKIRTDYYGLLATLYEEAFFKQIADWCMENNLQLTGHTEEDLLHHPRRQGDYFRTMRNLHLPGADCHDYRYRFPREISVHEPKYAVSVARAYGKPRAMSEAMGGAGWGCSLQEYKRGVNALGAMGINMFILHGFYNDCEHQGSQADWPGSFFFQNPYWKYFLPFAQYIQRISTMNGLGEAVVDAGVYYPIAELAAHTMAGEPDKTAAAIDRQFHRALRTLIENQIDADIIDRDSLLSAEVRGGRLCAGAQKFRLLVCPSEMQMTDDLKSQLTALVAQGGMVLFYPVGAGIVPEKFTKADLCESAETAQRFRMRFAPDLEIIDGSRDHLYANHRVVDGQDVYFIASTLPVSRRLRVSLRGRGAVRRLSPETGVDSALRYAEDRDRVLVNLTLAADEACWLLTGCERQIVPRPETVVRTILLDGAWGFLPLEAAYDSAWSIDAQSTVLNVPLARLTDVRTASTDDIRICNTAGARGRCGRHISLWKASWLGRRIGWGDDADRRDLYFKTVLTIKDSVLAARACVAAVNEFTLYINGQEAAQRKSNRTPCTLDIAKFLRKGRNLFAVHVHTDTPLDDRALTQAEAIPPEAPASLLLEAQIKTAGGEYTFLSDSSWAVASAVPPNWTQTEPYTVRIVDPKQVTCHVASGLKDTDWVQAWERGKPPILPWGDFPLFDETPQYPRTVRYTLTLPSGTVRLEPPVALGEISAWLDGAQVSFADGPVQLPADGKTHELRLDIDAPSADGGLLQPVCVHLRPQSTALGDWRSHGLAWFSGRALYKKTTELHKKPGMRYMLDLGKVCFCAEIWVNGALCSVRVWPPYHADITAYLREGANEIAVVAANSAACARRHMLVDEGMALAWNRYWNEDNIDREPGNLISGLLGPVVITEIGKKTK